MSYSNGQPVKMQNIKQGHSSISSHYNSQITEDIKILIPHS